MAPYPKQDQNSGYAALVWKVQRDKKVVSSHNKAVTELTQACVKKRAKDTF